MWNKEKWYRVKAWKQKYRKDVDIKHCLSILLSPSDQQHHKPISIYVLRGHLFTLIYKCKWFKCVMIMHHHVCLHLFVHMVWKCYAISHIISHLPVPLAKRHQYMLHTVIAFGYAIGCWSSVISHFYFLFLFFIPVGLIFVIQTVQFVFWTNKPQHF